MKRCSHSMLKGWCVVRSCWAYDNGPEVDETLAPQRTRVTGSARRTAERIAEECGYVWSHCSLANDIARLRALRLLRVARPELSLLAREQLLSNLARQSS